MAIFLFIIILSFLVIIHELGHLLAARLVGMKVNEFGLGYPPRAKTLFKWKETTFSLNWIPFGGFVQIKGEDGHLSDAPPKKGSFNSVSWMRQLIVIVAGAFVNFVFGALIFAGIFSYTGIPNAEGGIQITEISQNSPAAEIQLQQDHFIIGLIPESRDELVRIYDTPDLLGFTALHQGTSPRIFTSQEACPEQQAWSECLKKSEEKIIYIRTDEERPTDQGSMGIAFQSHTEYEFFPWYEMPFRGMHHGFKVAFELSRDIFSVIGIAYDQIASSGQTAIDLAGPVGIAHQVHEQDVFSGGWLSVLSFAAMISVNLAVMNLLPIPALDGGRAVFIVLRSVISAKWLRKIEYYTNYGGFIFLLALIIMITFKDIVRIFI